MFVNRLNVSINTELTVEIDAMIVKGSHSIGQHKCSYKRVFSENGSYVQNS